MNAKVKNWTIQRINSAPLGIRLTTNAAILPVLLVNWWDGLEISIGWWTWGIIIRRVPWKK